MSNVAAINMRKRREKFGYINSPEARKKLSETRIAMKKEKGYLNSLEARKKMSETHKKLNHKPPLWMLMGNRIPWNKGRKCPEISGTNNYGWKGGITPINEKIRKSLEYKQWRKSVFERDNYRCVGCGKKRGEDGVKVLVLNADHILPFFEFPRLRFDINNGRTLCVDCHRGTETWGRQSANFSIEGRPIIFLTT